MFSGDLLFYLFDSIWGLHATVKAGQRTRMPSFMAWIAAGTAQGVTAGTAQAEPQELPQRADPQTMCAACCW